MIENCDSLSVSLPEDLKDFLEQESMELHMKKSSIVQEELYKRKHRKKNARYEQMAYVFLLFAIGVTLWFFTLLILPEIFFSIFMTIGLISIIAGYVGFYLIYKKGVLKPIHKGVD